MRTNLMIAILAAAAAAPLLAQAAPPAKQSPVATEPQALPSRAAAEVVRDVIAVVKRDYVFPERAAAIVQRLEASLASGRYATSSPTALAERMSKDLFESSGNDGHMYINYNPAQAAALGSPGTQTPPDQSFFRQQMAAVNHGITELKVLPGNVRYMNISQWFWDEDGLTKAAYDDAMRFLRGGAAIIIDVRSNGGGDAASVQYVASHFLDPDQKIITFRSGPNEVMEGRSLPIAAGKITGKPVFLLVGPSSASASEEFAAHIKNFKVGTLIGKTTAGAGNPNTEFPTALGFVLSVSTGTATHAVTNAGWEGVGISPHREVDLSAALDVAHLEALKGQLATASPDRRLTLEWMIAGLSADGRSALTTAQLSALQGRYDGNRTISERAGRLYWKVADGPEQELIPLSGHLFAIGQKTGPRAQFDPNGSAVQLLRPTAPPERLEKVRG